MYILGINSCHADSSACLIKDGRLIAAAEEERFTRTKHWAGVPTQAILYCLTDADISIDSIDYIAVNRNPRANFTKKIMFALSKRPSFKLIVDRLNNVSKIKDIKEVLSDKLAGGGEIKAPVYNVEHHIAHLASSFYVSPFDEAAVVSVDGFGDFVGLMWGMAEKSKIKVIHRTFFPHSLGLFYLALTQYLGFLKYGDEYKVMGLAPYGEPEFLGPMRTIIKTSNKVEQDAPLFEMAGDYFNYDKNIAMTWDNGEPKMGIVFSPELEELLGPCRKTGEEISRRHKNIAASLQKRYEEVFFHVLNHVHKQTKARNLCIAGGCAMNSVANGKIFRQTPFRRVYIQAAAGDAGGALGAAYYLWNEILNQPKSFVMKNAFWGPAFCNGEIEKELELKSTKLEENGCTIEKIGDENELCRKTAAYIADAKVVGWFQGRMEWGPRALGNRSIVCDPRRADMKEILNLKIKRRESFRPFAPSILRESVKDWFKTDYDVPFMLQVYQIKEDKQKEIPAVTHVNGSGRLQTVTQEQNPLYYKLIKEFEKVTEVPIVLNTSFNENEPIVCKPKEALDCFLRTNMDVLVLSNYILHRNNLGRK